MRIFSACVVLAAMTASVLIGCVSSEETGGAGRTQTPQVVMHPVDTTRLAPLRPELSDSVAMRPVQQPTDRAKRPAPTFKTKQDTVRAATVRSKKPSTRIVAPIERPPNAKYSVQIGAFARAENALRLQKRARKQFPDIPVLNVYAPTAKLYRVSVGRFATREAAGRFRLELLKQYPKEYSQCWISYIAR